MTYNKDFKANNYFNRQVINTTEVMLLKDNTNYLNGNLKLFMYWQSINCTWISMYTESQIFFMVFSC